KFLRVLRIVTATQGAFLGLLNGSHDGLAHLLGHHPPKGLFLAFQNLGGMLHHLGAFGEWRLAVLGEALGGKPQLGFEYAVRVLLVFAQYVARGGIDADDMTSRDLSQAACSHISPQCGDGCWMRSSDLSISRFDSADPQNIRSEKN